MRAAANVASDILVWRRKREFRIPNDIQQAQLANGFLALQRLVNGFTQVMADIAQSCRERTFDPDLSKRERRAWAQMADKIENAVQRAREGDPLRGHGGNETDRGRLERIAGIIEVVDQRCLASDGPVPSTTREMQQAEMSEIYRLAKRKPRGWKP